MVREVLGSFTAVAFNSAQIIVVLVTVFFGVIFMLMNPCPVFASMLALFPSRHHQQAVVILQRIGTFVPMWAGATLLGLVTIGFLVFLLMWPIFGFMDALVLGLVAFTLEAIPFLGPILSAVPALLLAFGEGGMTPVWIVLAYITVQAFENNVIIPFLMASRMKLHPLAVIFSMLLCAAAFGVLGVLVAAPLVAVVTILHEELYRKSFLPTVTDAELNHMAGIILHEKQLVCRKKHERRGIRTLGKYCYWRYRGNHWRLPLQASGICRWQFDRINDDGRRRSCSGAVYHQTL